jgi:hypothetical protein
MAGLVHKAELLGGSTVELACWMDIPPHPHPEGQNKP